MYKSLIAAADLCDRMGVEIPTDILLDMYLYDVVKTQAHYERVLSQAVRELYNGKSSEDDFLSTMTTLLDEQTRRAWNEGMRLNDLDPAKDMTEAFEAELRNIQDEEFSHVDGFIAAIVQAGKDGTPVDPLLTRAGLWASRYPDIVSRAQVFTAPKDLNFRWIYGDTIQHCDTCSKLEGIVATAADWADLQARGIYPQSPNLDCSGFNCDCHLDSTDDDVTPGGIPSV
jgi:hypothetical protein